jgi:hypothetical protein
MEAGGGSEVLPLRPSSIPPCLKFFPPQSQPSDFWPKLGFARARCLPTFRAYFEASNIFAITLNTHTGMKKKFTIADLEITSFLTPEQAKQVKGGFLGNKNNKKKTITPNWTSVETRNNKYYAYDLTQDMGDVQP